MSTEATPPSPVPDTTPASAEASTPDTPAAPEQKPAADVPPPLPLPPEAEELDARVAAALVMVNHGIRRLSKLAGNIRFAFLQRDESRLVTERQKLKAAFQRQEHGPAELKFGLQALLQKAERMAGSLLYQPQSAAATAQAASPKPDESAQATAPETTPTQADSPASAAETPAANTTDRAVEAPAADTASAAVEEAGSAQPDANAQASAASAAPDAATPAPAPAAPALPREKSNQIRQTLRKSMMSLAPAAPLHLQIELAPAFAEAEPDIMAMAARVHALHRQVLGSLKGIQWHSAVHSTLSFEDGRTIEVRFGETGAEQIPEEFRQKQAPAQPARKPGQPGQRHGAPGGKTARPPRPTETAKAARARLLPVRGKRATPRTQPPRTQTPPPTGRAAPMARAGKASPVVPKAATARRAIQQTASRETTRPTPETGLLRGRVARARSRKGDATTRDAVVARASATDAAGAVSPATPPWPTSCARPWGAPSGWARRTSDASNETPAPDSAPKGLRVQGHGMHRARQASCLVYPVHDRKTLP